MEKQKIIINVTEKRFHKVTFELDEDEINLLIEEIDGEKNDDAVSNLCSNATVEDVEWELEGYRVL